MDVTYTSGKVERFRCFNTEKNRTGLLEIAEFTTNGMKENIGVVITFDKTKINLKHVAAVKFKV